MAISIFLLFPGAVCAKTPGWVISRPASPEFYFGIDKSEKKGSQKDYRRLAENRALYDLSTQISIDIEGSFVDVAAERTGLSEQDVRMEIRTSSQARLTGYERVDEWDSGKEYWVYYKLSKELYRHLHRLEREKAAAAAADMLVKGKDAEVSGNPVSALRFYFEALARVQDFIGENLQTTLLGKTVFLFNEIYMDIQKVMAGLRLEAERQTLPVMVDMPLGDSISAIATLITERGKEISISGLPVLFSPPGKGREAGQQTLTDSNGIANYVLPRNYYSTAGQVVNARVDVPALCPEKDIRRFFNAMIQKLTIPETDFILKPFSNKEDYLWHKEFDGQTVLVLSAYQVGNTPADWPKMHDEIVNFVKEKGARIERFKNISERQKFLNGAVDPNPALDLDSVKEVDYIIVMRANGKLKKRENAANPFGEDVQFAGEVQIVVHRAGQLHFSDQFRGATGWNPMGEEMCMDVLALHVFKRWKMKYLKRLNS